MQVFTPTFSASKCPPASLKCLHFFPLNFNFLVWGNFSKDLSTAIKHAEHGIWSISLPIVQTIFSSHFVFFLLSFYVQPTQISSLYFRAQSYPWNARQSSVIIFISQISSLFKPWFPWGSNPNFVGSRKRLTNKCCSFHYKYSKELLLLLLLLWTFSNLQLSLFTFPSSNCSSSPTFSVGEPRDSHGHFNGQYFLDYSRIS